MILTIFTLIGALGMFLYGMNTMSSGLQKAAGESLRKFIASMTSNPFKRVLTGFGVTATIQSSSATTVMVVGFVNAGLLTLTQAIGVIMGANIGTTMTAWIIAIFGFKADISALAVPFMAIGFLLSISNKSKRKNIGELIIGFSLLFLGLSLMKESIPDLKETPQVLEFIKNWCGHGFWSVLAFLGVGTILTLILQSSSATVALTLIMLNMNWIPFEMACAMVLGENIGTTITANIAASVGTTNARRAALAHTIFNLFGVVWALVLFYPLVDLVTNIVSILTTDADTAVLYGISTLHTLFNMVNTCVLIGLTPIIEKIVCAIIKDNKPKEKNTLKYINAGLITTPELALVEAHKEIIKLGETMKQSLFCVSDSIDICNDSSKFQPYRDKLVEYEQISDDMEFEIISFLNNLDKDRLSEDSSLKMRAIIRIVGELESLGDSGESISRTILHMNQYGRKFSDDHKTKLHKMITLLSNAYTSMLENISKEEILSNITNALESEYAINTFRSDCREQEMQKIEENGDAYFEGIFFINILEDMEKMGDFLINISQAALNKNEA